MTVVCQRCKREVSDYSFNKALQPVCSDCTGHRAVMEVVAEAKLRELERVWNDEEQSCLGNWVK